MNAKEHLESYNKSLKKEIRLREELERLEARWTLGAVELTDMPKAHGRVRDLSEFAALADKIEGELQDASAATIRIREEILEAMDKLKPEEHDVLYYRYIIGMDWQEIADKVGYELRSCFKVHARALDHYTPPATPAG